MTEIDVVRRIVRLRMQGYSPRRIAELLEMSLLSVREILKLRGLC